MPSEKAVTVTFGTEKAKFLLNSSEMSVADFSGWVRGRFAIASDSSILFKDNDGNEIVPSKPYLENKGSVEVEVIVKKIGAVLAQPKPKAKSLFRLMYFYIVAPFIVAYAIVQNDNVFARYVPVHIFCHELDAQLIQMGVITKTGVALEATIAFVCWATTYLFIRRMYNPETFVGCLERFSADSFYGGLAAAASIILKTYLVGNSSGGR